MRGYVLYDGSHHELVAEVLRAVPSGYKDPSFTCWKSLQGRDLGIHISSGVFFKIRLRLGLADRPMHVGARRALLRSEVHAGLHLLLELGHARLKGSAGYGKRLLESFDEFHSSSEKTFDHYNRSLCGASATISRAPAICRGSSTMTLS